jgi:hypothetical protein
MRERRCAHNTQGEEAIHVKNSGFAISMVATALLIAAPAFAQGGNEGGHGRAVVTIFAKHSEMAPNISEQDVSIKINGKDGGVTGWTPLRGANDGLELVVLIDSGAHNLGRQFEEIKQFIQGLSPHTKAAVGYMQNGQAVLASGLSADHAQVVSEIHLPAGPSSNPYFSLSDLAQRWPSGASGVRREVVLISDGIDPNNPHLDLDDTYVQAAITDSVRAGLVIYTIYWQSRAAGDGSSAGQSLLAQISQATGGYNYGTGMGNSVSFQPFFGDLAHRLENQYELDFSAKLDRKPAVESFKLKVTGLALDVGAPQQVFVNRAAAE